ncbi:hypothetical protein GIB67_006505 [Kingdonia uniflora]|uniref:Secoisolariciresinol dehydrogenase n=1 Tax=Kingdonia uniflora TaxID=39325 RepID=A0A7J7LEU1_9MAGN|nr:hypothetical protein GIB67_006505 [Kingdonia uniflora]
MLKLGSRNLVSLRDLLVKKLSLHNNRGLSTSHTASRYRLKDKVALITGAATGIGKATASEFISNGAKVVIADIQSKLGQATTSELGPNATFISCDVTQESDVAAAVDFTVAQYGHLDIMFNNVGISGFTPFSIVDLNLKDFDLVINTNVRGVIAGIKHASRVMIPQRSGSILCTASVAGVIGGLAPATYSISKFAIIGTVKSVAAELSRYGIRVNCISPFVTATAFVLEEMAMMFPGVEASRLVQIAHSVGKFEGANCETLDIAKAALYLGSDDAKYVSGHNLVVDGGFSSFKSLDFAAPDQVAN